MMLSRMMLGLQAVAARVIRMWKVYDVVKEA